MSWKSIETIQVHHCAHSYAIVLTHPLTRIVFSGDCRPSLELIEHGKNADVLIHEATFFSSSDLAYDQKQAESRRHTTGREAVIVGERMNARYVLMNHFSSRYPYTPSDDFCKTPGVCVAFDLMSACVGDMGRVDGYWDALGKLYGERRVDEGDGEEADLEDEKVEVGDKRKAREE
jgi:ribonuclease Z